MDELDNPLANLLRNPTSILPKEWKLEGRSYLDDDAPSAPAYVPEPAAPTLEPPPTTPSLPSTPSTDLTQSLDTMTQEEKIARLREQIERLQGLKPDAFTTSQAPIGVPPASAAEAPEGALLLHQHSAFDAAASVAQTPVSSGSDAAHSLLEAGAGFSAVADLGDVASSLLGTLIFAALGALSFEYIATNKAAPIPDPMLSGFWSSIHGAVRIASLGVGKAAKAAKGVLPF